MENQREKVCRVLESLGIAYELFLHPPMHTMEECFALSPRPEVENCKNLFLCDGKGRAYYLVMVHGDKQVDLKALAEKLECKGLRFASQERLLNVLQLERGAVGPLALFNDDNQAVTVVVDTNLAKEPVIGVHANDNASTVLLSYLDICRVLEARGNKTVFMEM